MRPVWVGQYLQPSCGRACKQQQHGLAGRGMHPMFGRLTHKIRAEFVGNDQAGILRKNLMRHVSGGRKQQPVAMHPIVLPFLIRAEIGNR